MSIKRILVHLDATERCDKRLQESLQIASYFNASLSGLFVEPPLQVNPMVAPAIAATATASMISADEKNHQEMIDEQKKLVKQKVHSIVSAQSCQFSWQSSVGSPQSLIAKFGNYHDLVIVDNQFDNDDLLNGLSASAGNIAVETSPPVLVLSDQSSLNLPVKKVLLFWNASKEAARSIADALPFLRGAEEVVLLCAEDSDSDMTDIHESIQPLTDFLRGHLIQVKLIDKTEEDISAKEVLKSEIEKSNYDLVVTGAHGHSQLRELFIHSTTHELLKQVSFPIFLSN